MIVSEILSIQDYSLTIHTNQSSVPILKGINLTIAEGEIIGLIGPSGCGKSMLAKSILGLTPKIRIEKQGIIRLGYLNLINASSKELLNVRNSQVGLIFQHSKTLLNPSQTIYKQISEKITLLNHDKANVKEEIKDLLECVGLVPAEKYFTRYVHELSGGQVQRVLIAIALANNPTLLIADEPVSALDSKTKEEILNLLTEIHQTRRLSILLISHETTIIERMCNRVYEMGNGEISESIDSDSWDPLSHGVSHGVEMTKQTKIAQPSILLDIKNLCLSYNQASSWFNSKASKVTTVFEDFSLQIFKGEILGIYGSSRSGKTSLAKVLSRLSTYGSGEMIWKGKTLSILSGENLKDFRSACQIIFQDSYSSLAPHRRLLSQMNDLKIVNSTLSDEMIIEMLTELGLEEQHLNRYPRELSGGQRKRMLIARTLLLDPEFIICDEILASLDYDVAMRILGILRSQVIDRGITLLYISHDLKLIERIADRVVNMDDYSKVSRDVIVR